MAFRWLRAYFERRDSRESYHYRRPPIYQKRGRNRVEFPEEYTQKRNRTEDSYGFVSRRQDDRVWQSETQQEPRPKWVTGWLGRGVGRGERGGPTEPPPRQEKPYEPWPGAGEGGHGWVEDERPYRQWPGEEDQRGGR